MLVLLNMIALQNVILSGQVYSKLTCLFSPPMRQGNATRRITNTDDILSILVRRLR